MRNIKADFLPNNEELDFNPRELKVRLMLLGAKQQDLIIPISKKLNTYIDRSCISDALNRGLTPKSRRIRVAVNELLCEWEERNKRQERARKRAEAKKEKKETSMSKLRQYEELGYTPEELLLILQNHKANSVK